MKKLVMVASIGTLMLVSCSGKTTACDCAQGLKDMISDYTDAGNDQVKIDNLEKKYEKLDAQCETLSLEMGQETFNQAMENCK